MEFVAFDVEGQGFITAEELRPGMHVTAKPKGMAPDVNLVADQLNDTSGALLVKVLKREAQPFTAYNLEIKGFHTFFVGKLGAWVHNTGAAETCVKKVVEAATCFAALKTFRSKWEGIIGQEILGSHGGNGVVAMLRIGGKKVFGVNSANLAEDTKDLARGWRDILNFGNAGDNQVFWHVEATALMRAYAQNKGLPTELTMFADKAACGPCQKGLPKLVEAMKVERLTISSADGAINVIGRNAKGEMVWNP